MAKHKYIQKVHTDTYLGDTQYSMIHNSDELFRVTDYTTDKYGTTTDDSYANSYINSIPKNGITISQSGADIVVNFPAATITQHRALLLSLNTGKTKIRVQLLNHKISSHCKPEPKRKVALELPYGYYWNNSASGVWDPDTEEYKNNSHWSRVRGTYKVPDGGWIDLTVTDLANGQVILRDAVKHAKATSYLADDEEDPIYITTHTLSTTHLSVEMFCPAFYRPGKDIFYYERKGNRAISSNCLTVFNINKQEN